METTKISFAIVFGCLIIGLSVFFSVRNIPPHVSTLSASDQFDLHVIERVFDECFDYYSNNKEIGIDDSLVKLCKQKIQDYKGE